ncbi:CLUMA_CG011400, isoform A [Clunio marinus]|uniref:CLUMA_CG011400, isoform A n=1 Tax=Clunio marinus TaxID=568069 RepID=A0A1J1ICM0_9DIPT|nr:CLUMA_CG011400, isoform A [Clunio marinus]
MDKAIEPIYSPIVAMAKLKDKNAKKHFDMNRNFGELKRKYNSRNKSSFENIRLPALKQL